MANKRRCTNADADHARMFALLNHFDRIDVLRLVQLDHAVHKRGKEAERRQRRPQHQSNRRQVSVQNPSSSKRSQSLDSITTQHLPFEDASFKRPDVGAVLQIVDAAHLVDEIEIRVVQPL